MNKVMNNKIRQKSVKTYLFCIEKERKTTQ